MTRTEHDADSPGQHLSDVFNDDDVQRAASTPAGLKSWQVNLRQKMPPGTFDARPSQIGSDQAPGIYSPVRFLLFWLCAPTWLMLGRGIVVNATIRELITRRIYTIKDWAEEVQLTMAVLNQRGGAGKTPVSTAVGAILAWVTQQLVLLVDTNQTKGNTASRIGVMFSMTIRQALEATLITSVVSYEWVVRVFSRHPELGYGSLRVMNSDEVEGRRARPVTKQEIKDLFGKVKPAVHSLIADNGNSTDAPTVEAAAEFCDVHCYVAFPNRENNLTDCRDTIQHYLEEMPDKVDRGLLVMVGDKHSWFNRKTRVTAADYALLFDFPVEQVVLIPHDPFYEVQSVRGIKNVSHETKDGDETIREIDSMGALDALIKTVTFKKLRRKTRLAYLDLIILAFEMQRRADAEKNLSAPGQEESDKSAPTDVAEESRQPSSDVEVKGTAPQGAAAETFGYSQYRYVPSSRVDDDERTQPRKVNLHELAANVRNNGH